MKKKQNILVIALILLAVISFGIIILVSGKENTSSLETTKDIIKMISIINKDNKNVLPELETMKINVKNIDEVTSYTGLKSNDDIESIINDLQIETEMKEVIDSILFSNLPIKKKRIEIRKLRRKGLERKFVRLFLKLLEYIEQI